MTTKIHSVKYSKTGHTVTVNIEDTSDEFHSLSLICPNGFIDINKKDGKIVSFKIRRLPSLYNLIKRHFQSFEQTELRDGSIIMERFLTALFWITGETIYRELRESIDKETILELKFLENK